MPYEHLRTIDQTWQVWREPQTRHLALARDGGLDVSTLGISSVRWARMLAQADGDALAVAFHAAGEDLAQEGSLERFLLVAEAITSARMLGRAQGLAAGLERARNEQAVSSSPEFTVLRGKAAELAGAVPVQLEGCPWIAGVTRRVGRNAAKAIFIFPWTLDRHAHASIVAAMREGLGLPVTGARDALGNHRPNCLVLAPTAVAGCDPRSASGVELRQDGYMQALRSAGLQMLASGMLAAVTPEAPADGCRP